MPHSLNSTHSNDLLQTVPKIKSSQLSVPSPDGIHVATINNRRLIIRLISNLSIVRSIDLPTSTARHIALHWSPISDTDIASTRVLVADTDTVRIYDLHDQTWSATIDNGSGGQGRNAHVDFGNDENEILVFGGFGVQITIWSLWTGRSIEIKDPKYSARRSVHGRSQSGQTGVFALISRSSALEVLSLHAPGSYSIIRRVDLPTTDAQGLKWSPDGRWLAIWESASMGFKVLIYTADGNLFRIYNRDYFDDCLLGLGIRSVEWSPDGNCLALGGYERWVTLLNTKTFSPASALFHTSTITPLLCPIHLETLSSTSTHAYTPALSSITPPPPSSVSSSAFVPTGTSLLSFSPTGTYLATKSDASPTTAWIFDLCLHRLCAVLVQHAEIKKLSWHPSHVETLLVRTQAPDNTVGLYLWSSSEPTPRVLTLPDVSKPVGRLEAAWLATPASSGAENEPKPAFFVGDTQSCVIAYPYGRDSASFPTSLDADSVGPSSEGHQRADLETEDDDSLYDILTGEAADGEPLDPAEAVSGKMGALSLDAGMGDGGLDGEEGAEGLQGVDDTFHYRRRGMTVH